VTYDKIQELMQPVYVEAGAGLLDCQRLEAALKGLLLCFARLGVGDFEIGYVESVFDGEAKKTAGQLLSMLKEKVDVATDAEQILAQGIAARNVFIHHFLIDNIAKVLDPASRERLVAELRMVRAEVQAAEHSLRPLLVELARTAGIADITAMQRSAEQAMLRNEDH
jgi:hypothetical protein